MKDSLRTSSKTIVLVVGLVFSFLLVSCSQIPENTWEELGTLSPSNADTFCSTSGACLSFPKGSALQEQPLKLRITSATDSQIPEDKLKETTGVLYEFSASKETFQKQFELKLPLQLSIKSSDVRVVFWQNDNWAPVPSRVTKDGKFVIGLTNHLSIWTIATSCPKSLPTQCAVIQRSQKSWKLCVDTKKDTNHCGKCGNQCQANQLCSSGTCQPPPCQHTRCGTRCINTKTDPQNCGKCGQQCPSGQVCSDGSCSTTCAKTLKQCANRCVNLQTDPAHCGKCDNSCQSGQTCDSGKCICPSSETLCNGICVKTNSNTDNCGQCSNKCSSGESCQKGTCQPNCPTGTNLCGNTCTKLDTDIKHCGKCNNKCSSGESCQKGTCRPKCTGGTTLCGNACVKLDTSAQHCGKCNNSCTSGKTCDKGICKLKCPTGSVLCGGACVNTHSDAKNCGKCNNACPSGKYCDKGSCQTRCSTGTTLCGNSCVKMNTSIQHCGKCNNKCAIGQTCSAGKCICPSLQTLCNGVCTNTSSNTVHCGKCNNKCVTGQTCSAGKCTCPSSRTLCNGACTKTSSDINHCGKCNNKCSTGQYCEKGTCLLKCPTGATRCGSACFILNSSLQHCGKCNNACTSGKTCDKGTCKLKCPIGTTICGNACVKLDSDSKHCGKCNNVCSSGNICEKGICKRQCPGGTQLCGSSCVNLSSNAQHCGKCNNACPTGQTCSAGICKSSQTAPSWFRHIQGEGSIQAQSMRVSSQGNIFITGNFGWKTLIGSTTFKPTGIMETFIAKIDKNGRYLWIKRTKGESSVRKLVLDSSENIYVTGNFSKKTAFGAHTLTSAGPSDIFVTKLDTNGKFIWATRAGGSRYDSAEAIAIDNTGNSHITGYFKGKAAFDKTTLASKGSTTYPQDDIFIAKLDPKGKWLWAKQAGSTQRDSGYGIAVDGKGAVYATGKVGDGYSSSTMAFEFGTIKIYAKREADIFVTKLDAKGTFQWAKLYGSSYSDEGTHIAASKSGDVYLSGHFRDTIAFGTTTLKIDSFGIFYAKLNTSGTIQYARKLGYNFHRKSDFDMRLDDKDNIYFAAGNTLKIKTTSSYDKDLSYVIKVDSTGKTMWSQAVKRTHFRALDLDKSGNYYVFGSFGDTITLNTKKITSLKYDDLIIIKNSPALVTTGLCPSGFTQCGNDCVDLQSNTKYCGTCNSACKNGDQCVTGKCTCPKGWAYCSGTCTPMSAPTHCGGCGIVCRQGLQCVDNGSGGFGCGCPPGHRYCGNMGQGYCRDMNSNQSCGQCGNICLPSQKCINQKCQ